MPRRRIPEEEKRVTTTITIYKPLRDKARELGINLSKVLERELIRRIYKETGVLIIPPDYRWRIKRKLRRLKKRIEELTTEQIMSMIEGGRSE